jgi:hypothetical protein
MHEVFGSNLIIHSIQSKMLQLIAKARLKAFKLLNLIPLILFALQLIQ